MNNKLKVIKIIIGIFFVVIAILLFINYQLSSPAGLEGSYLRVTIKADQAVGDLADILENSSLIKNKFWFKFWLIVSGSKDKIKAGTYNLPSNVNIYNLVRMITGSVELPNEITVRFIEGWNIKQIDDYLSQIGLVVRGDFQKAVSGGEGTEYIRKNFKGKVLDSWPGGSLEGYLFPDTYRVYTSARSEEIALRMINNLEKKWQANWNEILDRRGMTIHEALTLASIVEMEVPGSADRKLVADIFYKRIKAGMPLQADSTINYITGKKLPAVTFTDLQVDSPYNTYKYNGLPPGPISNPGLSSLQAVFEPTSNDYWFFLTTPSGQVIYSKNFDDHRAAKNKYLK